MTDNGWRTLKACVIFGTCVYAMVVAAMTHGILKQSTGSRSHLSYQNQNRDQNRKETFARAFILMSIAYVVFNLPNLLDYSYYRILLAWRQEG